ncbi:probable GTP-binding protein OBGM, mitochondrial isoform X2 [Prosopis cineraria]|uniref:probable GTP-binding protein OBGM, mitochondrial isoform X2 n=1 Tax=Prosopis cineraria TaxID=364024 RepID=UPI00241055FB|nr:probable GTP-binding protein OBGM, mitochondrial isoform X2 [Prosopis cineraria]
MLVFRPRSLKYIESFTKISTSRWPFTLHFYCSDSPSKKSKLAPLQERRMIDRFKIFAKGGDGGNGCSSFRRSRHDRKGRPDGGGGGRGGDVILECSPKVWDFSGLQHHLIAERGGQGASKNMIGTRGADKVVHVPVGTVLHLVKGDIPSTVKIQSSTDADPWDIPGALVDDLSDLGDGLTLNATSGKEEIKADQPTGSSSSTDASCRTSKLATVTEGEQQILCNVAELTEEGQQIIIARGGEGGLGNISASKDSRKSLIVKAAGKDKASNLQNSDDDSSSISAGLPGSETVLILELKSIADVSFVGMPNAVADIPGLIKGAHQNRGLGHAFLRHIERTKVLAYVVDLAAALDARKGIPPWVQLKDLILELEYHQEGLSNRPSLVVANKIDEEGAEEVYEELQRRVKDVPIFPVCAVLEEGIPELKDGLRMLVNGEKSCRLCLDKILLH